MNLESGPVESRRSWAPPIGYSAALEGAALVDRTDHRFIVVSGRAPARMLAGLLSGSLPPDLGERDAAGMRGRMPYSALLTPKGKIVSDLRIARLGNGDEGPFLLEFPASTFARALEWMERYLPPRLARVEEPPIPIGLLTLIGPEAEQLVDAVILDGSAGQFPLNDLEEGEEIVVEGSEPITTRVVRTDDVTPLAWDLIAPHSQLSSYRERLVALGALNAPVELWETLRVERGRPACGIDFDEETLPPEAGIEERAIDHRKGCYTGQEVIVRIRDRGKVNRRLRGILLGGAAPPMPRTPLFHAERESPVGETRSAVRSPRLEQTIALAYVRREIEPQSPLRLGKPDGPEAQLRLVDSKGWVLVEGDAAPIA